MTVALKRSQLRNVPLLFRWIESSLSKDPAHPGAALLKEWSISNSTLEEVFLRLCAADTTVNAGIDRPDDSAQDDDAQRRCAVCRVRPVSVVTLYTAGGVPVVLPNILCGPCSFGPLLAEQKAPRGGGGAHEGADGVQGPGGHLRAHPVEPRPHQLPLAVRPSDRHRRSHER